MYALPETTETLSNRTTAIHRNTDHVDETEQEAIDDTDGGKRTDLQEDVVVVVVFAVATSNGVVDDDAVVVGGDFNCGNAFCGENNDDLALELELIFALVLKWDFLRRYPGCLAELVVTGPKSNSFDVPFNDALPVDPIIA